MGDIAAGATPFVLLLVLMVVILFLVPDVALWLPRQMMPGPR
jgi:TRAP-type mannitol/chloroaromatic compound transport system permease large subunit